MTRPGGRALAALLLAAILGISGGVLTALQRADEPTEQQADDPSRSEPPSGPTTGRTTEPSSLSTPGPDKLKLGVPREDLGCDGDTYILVGWGRGDTALLPHVIDWRSVVKYLNTRKSCPAFWPKVRGEPPKWVAYLPGYEFPTDACEARMTAEHKADYVTRMEPGNDSGVPCACVLEVSTLPTLAESDTATAEGSMWIYVYQRMLADIGLLAEDRLTQLFDKETAHATYTLQSGAGMSPSGVVDVDTWGVLRSRACHRYEY